MRFELEGLITRGAHVLPSIGDSDSDKTESGEDAAAHAHVMAQKLLDAVTSDQGPRTPRA